MRGRTAAPFLMALRLTEIQVSEVKAAFCALRRSGICITNRSREQPVLRKSVSQAGDSIAVEKTLRPTYWRHAAAMVLVRELDNHVLPDCRSFRIDGRVFTQRAGARLARLTERSRSSGAQLGSHGR